MSNPAPHIAAAKRLKFPAHQERVYALLLDDGGQVVGGSWLALGDARSAPAPVERLVELAKKRGCRRVALAHNHPSGALWPSAQDLAATDQLRRETRRRGVELVDHVVVAGRRCVSILGHSHRSGLADSMTQLADPVAQPVKKCAFQKGAVSRETPRVADFEPANTGWHIHEVHELAHRLWDKDKESYNAAYKRAWAELKAERGQPAPAKPARRQAAAPAPDKPARKPGKKAGGAGNLTTASGPDPNKQYEFRYRVVELDRLIASHTDALAPNPAFPRELQPRIRERAASRLQIEGMAKNLQPDALLLDGHTLDRGPMIVGPDLVVESGNGRTLALRKARAEFPARWEAYQERLRQLAPQYGVKVPPGLTAPVLARQRLTAVDRVAFAAEANAAATLTMSPLEQALQDAGRITDGALAGLTVGETQTVDQALTSAANRPLAAGFLSGLPANERAALVGAGGELNQLGLQRLKAAIFAKVYPGAAGLRLTKAFFESLDPILKNVEAAMFDSLPAMARAEGLMRSGQRARDLSLGDDLARAVDTLARLKAQRLAVGEHLAQQSAFGRELDPTQERLLAHLDQFGRSRKALREFLKGYAEAVEAAPHPSQGAMFGADAQESKAELVARLMAGQTRQASGGALFELIEARERAYGVADPGRRRFPHWAKAQPKKGARS